MAFVALMPDSRHKSVPDVRSRRPHDDASVRTSIMSTEGSWMFGIIAAVTVMMWLDTLASVTVPVKPDQGDIVGRVLHRCNKEPAQGFYVYVFPGREGNAFLTRKVQADSDGFYRVGELDPGTYRLTASQNPDSRGFSYRHAVVDVEHGPTTAPDILVRLCPDIQLTSPSVGEVLRTPGPTFEWAAYADDAEYEVMVYRVDAGRFDPGVRSFYRFPPAPFPKTTDTVISVPEDLPPGEYEWTVAVYEPGRFLSVGDSPRRPFTIVAEKQ